VGGWVTQQGAARAKAGDGAGRGFFPTHVEASVQQLTAEVQWLRGEWLRATQLQEAAEQRAAAAAAEAEAERERLRAGREKLERDSVAAAQRVRDDEAALQSERKVLERRRAEMLKLPSKVCVSSSSVGKDAAASSAPCCGPILVPLALHAPPRVRSPRKLDHCLTL
jgi:hypothetical protein